MTTTTTTTKEINCTRTNDQLCDLGEPTACVEFDFPKEAKHLGSILDDARFSWVCLQINSERKKWAQLIASNGHIITVWPVPCAATLSAARVNDEPKHYDCFIAPKAVAALAGKRVELAMWRDNYNRHDITTCGADDVRAQFQLTGARCYDWRRVMNRDVKFCCAIGGTYDVPKLRKFARENMGAKKERDSHVVVLSGDKDSRVLVLRAYNLLDDVDKPTAELKLPTLLPVEYDFQLVVPAWQLYYGTSDFIGNIRCTSDGKGLCLSLSGVYSETMILPVVDARDGLSNYFKCDE